MWPQSKKPYTLEVAFGLAVIALTWFIRTADITELLNGLNIIQTIYSRKQKNCERRDIHEKPILQKEELMRTDICTMQL